MAAHRGAAACGVERAAQERARARGLDQRHAAVHHLLLDQVPVARGGSSPTGSGCPRSCGCSRSTRSAPSESACRGQRPRGRPGARPTPRPRSAARRGRAPPRPARPRRPPRRSRWARPPWPRPRPGVSSQRALERLRRHAVGDVQLGVELRRHERGPQAGEDERVDRARVRVALDDHLAPAVGEGEQRHVVALRRAVHEEPGRAWRPTPRPPGPGPARRAWARSPTSMP